MTKTERLEDHRRRMKKRRARQLARTVGFTPMVDKRFEGIRLSLTLKQQPIIPNVSAFYRYPGGKRPGKDYRKGDAA